MKRIIAKGLRISKGRPTAGVVALLDAIADHESPKYRDAIKPKISAHHLFIHAGVVAQGLLEYLSATFPALVWNSFGSWLRTIRPGIPPSELVVAHALRHTLPHFLLTCAPCNCLAKFIVDRQDPEQMDMFRLTG